MHQREGTLLSREFVHPSLFHRSTVSLDKWIPGRPRRRGLGPSPEKEVPTPTTWHRTPDLSHSRPFAHPSNRPTGSDIHTKPDLWCPVVVSNSCDSGVLVSLGKFPTDLLGSTQKHPPRFPIWTEVSILVGNRTVSRLVTMKSTQYLGGDRHRK